MKESEVARMKSEEQPSISNNEKTWLFQKGNLVRAGITQKQRKNSASARGNQPASRKNLKQWTKGCPSPNPGGRPKGSSITSLLRRALEEMQKNGTPHGEAD